MNTTLKDAIALATRVREALTSGPRGVHVVLCPPFVSLAAVAQAVDGSGIAVGAQNMYFEAKGAFTGEVSPAMLAGLCQYVILGHSERRHIFGERDDLINRKVVAAFAAGLRPILCVGETLEERKQGRAEEVIGGQLRAGLEGVEQCEGLVVAYEPVWAIGTGVPATPDIAQEVMGGVVLATLSALFGEHAALEAPLLYGGSVNPGNVAAYARQPAIHGALVGGASLVAEQFVEIVQTTARAKGVA